MIRPKALDQLSEDNSILFIEAAKNYSIIYFANGTNYVSGYTLKFHLDFLDDRNFIRPNRSMLVHKSYVSGLKETGRSKYAILKNGLNVLIARRKFKMIQQELSISRS